MKKTIIIFCLLFLQIINAQNFVIDSKFTISQNYIYLAELELANKNYSKSQDYFLKAFQLHSAMDSYQLLDAAACALQLKNEKLFEKYVIESIVFYKAPLDFILEYDKFKDYKNNSFLKNLSADYENYLNQYYVNKKNVHAYIETSLLLEEDQVIRSIIEDLETTLKSSQVKINKDMFTKILTQKDDEIAQKLISITKKYGFQESCWLILWHHRVNFHDQDDAFWQYFKTVIEKEISKGNLHKSYLSSFVDINKLILNQDQVYGTLFQFPISNAESIDSLRESVGLPPLLYDKIIYGRQMPENYQLTEGDLRKMLFKRVSNYDN